MAFEEVLANCLARLEQGGSIEECLAQYPAHRDELAPILHMIAPMRHGPKPRLSARAFARGRAAVAAHARHQQKLREPFIAATQQAVQSRPFYTPTPVTPGLQAAQVKLPPAPLPTRSWFAMQRWLGALLVLVLALTFASFVRGVASSLPGSMLYPIKGWGENTQGLLMMASGQQASWHVNQLERRLTEFALLTQQSVPVSPALTTAIADHLQAALDTSATMNADRRNQFLSAWLDRLHTLQQDLPMQTTTVATLNHAISTVEQAAQRHNEPTILPMESTATPVPLFTPSAIPTVALPTVTPEATEPPILLATPTATLVEILPTPTETSTAAVIFEPATPTPTNTAVVITPAMTETPQLIPEEGNQAPESGDDEEHGSSKQVTPTATALPAATATPIATLPPPRIPLPTGAPGEETPATVAPTEIANETRVPGGIPTSAEPPTPVPTEGSRNTPTPTEKAATATPTRTENKISTPEPTATRAEAKTNTPEPTNTPKAETPEPDEEQATPTAEETAESSAESEESTPEPTPTPKKKKK